MKHLIYKKLEDGTYGEKLGSYEGAKDDSSANRSHLQAEPNASHFELADGVDEDCVDLVDGALVLNSGKVLAKAAAAQLRAIQNALSSAKSFGESLMNEFTVENITLGITADAMTGTVRKNMSEVIMALQTGSLYDAIVEAKLIPTIQKDAKYITDARLLSFVNKIETKLGITLSTTL